MTQFRQRPGTRSSVLIFKDPFPDIAVFDTVIRSLIMKNPLGCTSYMSAKANHPPIQKVREMYTAKFVYKDADGKQIGRGSEVYNTREGYENGVAGVISNMANIAAHGGKVRHIPGADLFAVTLRCHDPNGELCFLSLARKRLTLSSFNDDEIHKRVGVWADVVSAQVSRDRPVI
jgi:hypothetical protein